MRSVLRRRRRRKEERRRGGEEMRCSWCDGDGIIACLSDARSGEHTEDARATGSTPLLWASRGARLLGAGGLSSQVYRGPGEAMQQRRRGNTIVGRGPGSSSTLWHRLEICSPRPPARPPAAHQPTQLCDPSSRLSRERRTCLAHGTWSLLLLTP
jgi:hypothetical protein